MAPDRAPLPREWRDDPLDAAVQYSAPLSRWQRLRVFDTRLECRQERKRQGDLIEALEASPAHRAVLVSVWAASRCVQADELKAAP